MDGRVDCVGSGREGRAVAHINRLFFSLSHFLLRGTHNAKLAPELNRLTRSEMHSYVKLMFSFGVGVVVLGLGGVCVFRICCTCS